MTDFQIKTAIRNQLVKTLNAGVLTVLATLVFVLKKILADATIKDL
tara:strand:+ start:53 stop:190 length:138 start_codon:yes stop_codon:yes gene_type:complete